MPKPTTRPKRDLHAEITQNLIEAIEANPGHPQMPWRRSSAPLWLPANATTGALYNGINVLNLWARGAMRGFTAPLWATYRQWSSVGAQVIKGAKSETIIFYKEFEVAPNPDDANDDGKRRVAKASRVFNVAEVDGFEAPEPPEQLGPIERIALAEAFIAAANPTIRTGGQDAYYAPSQDLIQMPDEGLFVGTETLSREEGYYATLLHELTHWTGHASRCDRDMSGQFGNATYAAEELVAEIGSAFLCAELGITQDLRLDHAQYIAHWLNLMKDDPKAIFSAAAQASRAVQHLKAYQVKATPPEPNIS